MWPNGKVRSHLEPSKLSPTKKMIHYRV